jgi:hypothetical protein
MISDYENIDTNSSSSSTSPSPQNSDIIINIVESPVNIDNIQEETNLIDYTENHFNTKIQQELKKIRSMRSTPILNIDTSSPNYTLFSNHYVRSNSPITISNNGSRSNSNHGSDSDSNSNHYDSDNELLHSTNNIKCRKLSFRSVEKMIEKYYSGDNKYSGELDILTTYMKAQKNLYIQSKHITQHKLNCLMIPSLLFTAILTIVSPFFECTVWSVPIVSGMNAIIMLFISLINYLKLESSIEIYVQNAKQYDKLESSLELTNNKLLFIDDDKEKSVLLLNKIKEIEIKMNEIKESTNILIPEEIQLLFPIISNINIFSFIKKVKIHKKNLILKFKDVKNEIRYIYCLWNSNHPPETIDTIRQKNRLDFLCEVKNNLKEELLEFSSVYSHIDCIFTKEIKIADSKKNRWSFLFFWKTPIEKSYYKGTNPMIDKYFQFIFVD